MYIILLSPGVENLFCAESKKILRRIFWEYAHNKNKAPDTTFFILHFPAKNARCRSIAIDVLWKRKMLRKRRQMLWKKILKSAKTELKSAKTELKSCKNGTEIVQKMAETEIKNVKTAWKWVEKVEKRAKKVEDEIKTLRERVSVKNFLRWPILNQWVHMNWQVPL